MRVRPVPVLILICACATLILSAGLAVAGCGSSSSPDAQAAKSPPVKGVRDVVASQLRFSPPAVEIPAGTTVTWHFDDGSVPHNVSGKGFASPNLTRTTWSHRFDQPGTYSYRCTLHANMVGRVVVTPK